MLQSGLNDAPVKKDDYARPFVQANFSPKDSPARSRKRSLTPVPSPVNSADEMNLDSASSFPIPGACDRISVVGKEDCSVNHKSGKSVESASGGEVSFPMHKSVERLFGSVEKPAETGGEAIAASCNEESCEDSTRSTKLPIGVNNAVRNGSVSSVAAPDQQLMMNWVSKFKRSFSGDDATDVSPSRKSSKQQEELSTAAKDACENSSPMIGVGDCDLNEAHGKGHEIMCGVSGLHDCQIVEVAQENVVGAPFSKITAVSALIDVSVDSMDAVNSMVQAPSDDILTPATLTVLENIGAKFDHHLHTVSEQDRAQDTGGIEPPEEASVVNSPVAFNIDMVPGEHQQVLEPLFPADNVVGLIADHSDFGEDDDDDDDDEETVQQVATVTADPVVIRINNAVLRHVAGEQHNPYTGLIAVARPVPLDDPSSRREDACEIALYNVTSYEHVGTLSKHLGEIVYMCFDPYDKRRFASCGQDNMVRIWDLFTCRQIIAIEHTAWMNCANFSQNGKMLVTLSQDYVVYVWDISDTTQPVHAPKFFTNGIRDFEEEDRPLSKTLPIFFCCNDSKLVTAGRYFEPNEFGIDVLVSYIKIWSTEPGTNDELCLGDSDHPYVSYISLAVHPDGNVLVAGQSNGNLDFIDINEGCTLFEYPFHGVPCRRDAIPNYHGEQITRSLPTFLSWDGMGKRLGAADVGGMVKIWDIDLEGKLYSLFSSFDVGPNADLQEITMNADGTKIALNSLHDDVFIMDCSTGERVARFPNTTKVAMTRHIEAILL